jgi:hypothetical protein
MFGCNIISLYSSIVDEDVQKKDHSKKVDITKRKKKYSFSV